MKYTAVIVEDEVPARDTLKSYLERYFENIRVIAEIDNVEEALDFLNDNEVDILFLDVQLTDGSGVDILENIKHSKFNLVFTTAFDEYAVDAFKHKSFGYLLKPLDPDDFVEIVNRVINDLTVSREKGIKKIKVSIPSGNKWIVIDNIIRCEAESNYTRIIVKDKNATYIIAKTLKTVENEMINSSRFVRVHASHLINLDHISDMTIQHNKIIMKNGDEIPVSKAHRNIFLTK